MNLIVDIGNTLVKVFFFEGKKIGFSQQIESAQKLKIFDILNCNHEVDKTIISSVVELDNGFYDKLKSYSRQLVILDEYTKLPITNEYKTKDTLGKDRIAAAVGAYTIFPETNVIAIDAGTALTIDFISDKGEYIGGNISPGLSMRFSALNNYTSKLPLLGKNDQFPLLGKNTNEAIVAGVQNGIIFEIDNYISEFLSKYSDLKVILTGGDSFFFAHKLKSRIFAEPFLTAIGLNRILEYNVKQI
ncbi:MAG: type III pantothenate kinase [Bacteroidota bacterium]